MHIVCLDLEGVLVPEIWIAVAETTGIEDLRLTTRDIPDYDVLMKGRIRILDNNGLALSHIQEVITGIRPLDGALDFLERLRSKTQVIILSDTFYQFAKPLLEKLNKPVLFCNTLLLNGSGMIKGYRLRQNDGKRKSVEAFNGLGFRTLAVGDSYNDLSMLKAAEKGVLFRPPENIRKEVNAFPVTSTYEELDREIDRFLQT